jgi:hypothetical protein
MALQREIRAKEILWDIRRGLTNAELMEKYKLTPKGLTSAFKKLVAARVLTEESIEGRWPYVLDPGPNFVETPTRQVTREKLDFPIPIYNSDDPSIRGVLSDVSESGLGVTGLSAREGEEMTLVVPVNDLFNADQFVVRAKCRWARGQGRAKEPHAGFQVAPESKPALDKLCRLIQSLTFEDRTLRGQP